MNREVGVVERFRNVAFGTALAAGVLASGCATETSEPAALNRGTTTTETEFAELGEPTTTVTELPPSDLPKMTDPEAGLCIEPQPEDFAQVREWLAEPKNPALIPTYSGKSDDGAFEEFEETSQAFLEELASDLDQTIYDATPVIEDLNNRAMANSSEGNYFNLPFQDYLSATQDFMANYGVQVMVGTPDMDYAFGGRAPDAELLESDNAKQTLINVLYAFSEQPDEYITDVAKLDDIVLMSGAEDEAGAYAQPGEFRNQIYINIQPDGEGSAMGSGSIHHELAHLVDFDACNGGGYYSDPAYEQFNGGLDIYDPDVIYDTVTVDYGDYIDLTSDLMSTKITAEETGAMEQWCDINDREKAIGEEVLTYSEYHPEVGEDKAEVGAGLAQQYTYGNLTDPRFPVLKNKFELLLARLHVRNPKVAEYFIKTADRPYIDPLEASC